MRAKSSGIQLTSRDASIVKAMILRGDRQHDIAAWFGVNGGRIGEISTGDKFGDVDPIDRGNLPPPGPYPSGRDAVMALQAISEAKAALEGAEKRLFDSLS